MDASGNIDNGTMSPRSSTAPSPPPSTTNISINNTTNGKDQPMIVEFKEKDMVSSKEKKKRVWGSLFSNKKTVRKVFGVSLAELECFENTRIPILAVHTIEYLKTFGLDTEGLFRIPGSQKFINEMKSEYDSSGGRHGVYPGSDVHAVSGLLKQFLRDLPEPLLTYDLYPHLIEAQTQREMVGRLCALRDRLSMLPEASREVLKYLLEFLTLVCQHSENNKMTSMNLAITFGPLLLQPKDANGMKLIEEAPHVNRIVKTLIDEYQFVLNGADVPLCVMEEDAGWSRQGARNKKGSTRAKSDPIRTPLNVAHGLKAGIQHERETQSARDGQPEPVFLPSIRRKNGTADGAVWADREGEEVENESGGGVDGDSDAFYEHDDTAQLSASGESHDGSGATDPRVLISTKRLSWSVLDVNGKAPKPTSPNKRPTSSCENQLFGPTTSSVARMKALIAKANADKELMRIKRATVELRPGEVMESDVDELTAVERAISGDRDASVEGASDTSPQESPIAADNSSSITIPPPLSKRYASSSDLYAKAQTLNEGSTAEPEKQRRGGSRIFGLTLQRPDKEKKHKRKERQREKKEEREREREQEKEEIIALLFDRLRLWRERERIPENVQFMNIKQLKAEKKWLKKELNPLDSKREREELRTLHLRKKELSFYLERMRKDKTGAASLASSSAAMQSYSAFLKDLPPPTVARPAPLSRLNVHSSATNLLPAAWSPRSPRSAPSELERSLSPRISPPLSPPLSPPGLSPSSSCELSELGSGFTTTTVTSPAVAAALKSRFTREGSADTALMTKPPSHKGHARSKSFIFRQSANMRGKEGARDKDGSGSHTLTNKKRKGSKIDNAIIISSPIPVEREPPPLHQLHQQQQPSPSTSTLSTTARRNTPERALLTKSSDNTTKRKSGSKVSYGANKRRSGFPTDAEAANGCSRENLEELSMLAKSDQLPMV